MQTLAELLSHFPHITQATEADNSDILKYYHQTELASTENNVIYKRGDDFFAFLKERSESFFVFLLRDDEKKIKGMGVANYRPGFIKGQLTTVGYLGDLRISMNRKLIREWRDFYSTLIKNSGNLPETFFCKYYQTAIIETNNYSKNNLVETKIKNLHYQSLSPYRMINIVGLWSFSSPKDSGHIRWAKKEDKKELINFLKNDHQKRLFGYDWEKELEHRLQYWPHFGIENFFLVFDPNDPQKILAASSLWNPITSKQIMVTHIPKIFKILSKIAKIIPALHLKPLPKKMTPIEILYLNQISFASGLSTDKKKDLLRDIVLFAFKEPCNMLAYCDFIREDYLKGNLQFITQKMTMGLYSVHYKENHEIKDDLHVSPDELSPTFDMALV